MRGAPSGAAGAVEELVELPKPAAERSSSMDACKSSVRYVPTVVEDLGRVVPADITSLDGIKQSAARLKVNGRGLVGGLGKLSKLSRISLLDKPALRTGRDSEG